MKVVKVTWRDSVEAEGWVFKEDIPTQAAIVSSVGFLVAKVNSGNVILARDVIYGSKDEETTYGTVTYICSENIIEIEEFSAC